MAGYSIEFALKAVICKKDAERLLEAIEYPTEGILP